MHLWQRIKNRFSDSESNWLLWVRWVLATTVGTAIGWIVGSVLMWAVGERMCWEPGWIWCPDLGLIGRGFTLYVLLGAGIGLGLGLMQWLVLRRYFPQAGHWIWMSGAGPVGGFGLIVLARWLVYYSFGSSALDLFETLIGGLFGLGLGLMQWLVLRRWLRRAGWWMPAWAGGVAAGWFSADQVERSLGGAAGFLVGMLVVSGLVSGIITGGVLIWLRSFPKKISEEEPVLGVTSG